MDDEFRVLGWKILGGKSYTRKEAPSGWHNDTAISYSRLHISHSQLPFVDPERHDHFIKANVLDPKQLPLHTFPLIEDFEVILCATLSNRSNEENQLRYRAGFFSPSRGWLTIFRYGNFTPQDLSESHFTIPCGDFTTPYCDYDQGWAILIAERDEMVYILTGNFEKLLEKKGYHTWFKVEKSRYYHQWEKAIDLCRQWCAQQQAEAE